MKHFTSILSSPNVSVGDPFLLKKENDRFPTTTLGNDHNNNDSSHNPAGRTLAGRQFLGDDGNNLAWGSRTVSAFVKRAVVMSLICLFSTVNAPAEIISAVSYNPSRMGDYVYLKVADKANLKGGIESNTMTVRSGGTVSASSPNLNYDVPTVVGETGSTLDMPNTAIHGSVVNTYNGYQAVNTGTPSALLNTVYVNGGQTTVKNDSYISTLDAVNRLKQKAATLRANKLSVSGSEDASLYDGATTDGFTLAGNDIPQPTSSHVNTGSALSNCTLKWEERVTSDNQKVKLLALTNCNGATIPDTTPKSCPGGYTYEASTNKCCRSDVPQSSSQPYAWGAPSGCTLPNTDTLSYPGLARCTSNCPHSTACVRMINSMRAQFSTGTSEKKTPQVSALTCYNGRWVYKENGVIYDKLDTLLVSAVIERCPTTCVDPI